METSTVSRRTALIAVSLTSFLTPFMASGVSLGLPGIGESFAMSAVLLGWVATSYTLAAAVFLVPLGKAADIHGRKRVYVLGTALYTLASALCALARSGAGLIVARALQGVGSAMIFGTGIAILTSVFPPEQRGYVMGINTAVTYGGLSAGPFLGGLLVGAWGWRSVFWSNVPLGVIAALFMARKVQGEWADAPSDSFDLLGSVAYGIAVVGGMYGLSRLPDLSGAALIAAAAAVGALFVWHERRARHPVLDLRLFRGNRTFTLSSLAALIDYSATSSVTFLMSLYLQVVRGMSPRLAGTVLVAQPVLMAIFSPLAGRLSDRIEPRLVASAGMSTMVVGLTLLALLQPETELAYVLVCLVLLGLGFAFFSSPNVSAIMGSVARQYYGVASGMVGTMRLFGQMLSMGIAMLLFSIYIGQVQITPANYDRFMLSARTNFAISALLCVLGVLASASRGRLRDAETAAAH